MKEQYSPNIRVMLDAVRKASRGLIRDFGELENLQVSKKGPKDFVSSADLRAEETLIRELKKARPDYSILSEESGYIKGETEEYCWIIDPLDGTTNFLHSYSFFCTTIALQKTQYNGKKEIIAAVTAAPILKEIFWAEKGFGVWLESSEQTGSFKLRVSARDKINESLLAIGSYIRDSHDELTASVAATRCTGSTALALAYTAAGRFDSFIQNDCYAWDMAAGILFINEAKGAVSDFGGKQDMFASSSIIASNADLHPLILKKIAKK
jgi:myo-inositol-1(or 4)-monophosphatase